LEESNSRTGAYLRIFFIDEPDGTDKAYCINGLLNVAQRYNKNAIAVASSGTAYAT
jgi:hypothetical protein